MSGNSKLPFWIKLVAVADVMAAYTTALAMGL